MNFEVLKCFRVGYLSVVMDNDKRCMFPLLLMRCLIGEVRPIVHTKIGIFFFLQQNEKIKTKPKTASTNLLKDRNLDR